MRIKYRAWLLYGLFLAVPTYLDIADKERVLGVPFNPFIWFAIFAGGQFIVLRCPHCGRSAVRRGLPGDRCLHCEEEF